MTQTNQNQSTTFRFKEYIRQARLSHEALKALDDIPNYHKADGEATCANCVLFKAGNCVKYKAKVKPDYMCDEWEGETAVSEKETVTLKNPGHASQLTHGFRLSKPPSLAKAREYRKAGVLQDYLSRAREPLQNPTTGKLGKITSEDEAKKLVYGIEMAIRKTHEDRLNYLRTSNRMDRNQNKKYRDFWSKAKKLEKQRDSILDKFDYGDDRDYIEQGLVEASGDSKRGLPPRYKEASPTPSTVMAHGTGGLFSDPALETPKKKKKQVVSAKESSLTPPESAKNAAKRALEWRDKYGGQVKAMTPVGWTRARQLASGKPLSMDTVKRMAQFNRHRKNADVNPKYKNEPWRDNGYVAWLGWGGTGGIDWAISQVNKANGKQESMKEAALDDLTVTEKHLSGQHNQKRHGYRFGGELTGDAKSRLEEAGLLNDYKRRSLTRQSFGVTGKKPETSNPAKLTQAFGTDPNKRYEFKYKVVDLNDLIASNTATGAINPAYAKELQPRDRERVASQHQIDDVARNLVPESVLWDFHQIDKGTPIIGNDNMVESGNGRTLALQRAKDIAPEKWQEYQDKLQEQAKQYGLGEKDFEGIKNPVLVRERLTSVDRAEFAKEANSASVLQMSPLEVAKNDARKIKDESLFSLQVGDNQSIDEALRSPKNGAFVQKFMTNLPDNERASLMRSNGTLNQMGLWRMKAAIFSKVFPGEAGERIADTFLEALDSTTKNFESGISKVLPRLAQAESLISSGQRANVSIMDDASKSIDMLARLRENGTKVSDYLSQGSLFGRELSPTQERLLSHFDNIGRSSTKISEFFNTYADTVFNLPNANQTGLFGGSGQDYSKEDIFAILQSAGVLKEFRMKETKPSVPKLTRKQTHALKPDSLGASLNWDRLMPNGDIWNDMPMSEEKSITTKPSGKSPGASIKNPLVYEALLKKGMPKGMAAAISNAQVKGSVAKKEIVTVTKATKPTPPMPVQPPTPQTPVATTTPATQSASNPLHIAVGNSLGQFGVTSTLDAYGAGPEPHGSAWKAPIASLPAIQAALTKAGYKQSGGKFRKNTVLIDTGKDAKNLYLYITDDNGVAKRGKELLKIYTYRIG